MQSYIQEPHSPDIITRWSGVLLHEKKRMDPNTSASGLNDVKNRYTLLLMSTAFGLLQGATVFTKLDLRNAHHLVRIQVGEE